MTLGIATAGKTSRPFTEKSGRPFIWYQIPLREKEACNNQSLLKVVMLCEGVVFTKDTQHRTSPYVTMLDTCAIDTTFSSTREPKAKLISCKTVCPIKFLSCLGAINTSE